MIAPNDKRKNCASLRTRMLVICCHSTDGKHQINISLKCVLVYHLLVYHVLAVNKFKESVMSEKALIFYQGPKPSRQ